MMEAKKQGIPIDFSAWGESVEPLLAEDEETIAFLLDLDTEFHTSLITQGIAAAKAKKTFVTRPKKTLPDNESEEIAKWIAGQCSAQEAAQTLGISIATLYRRSVDIRHSNKKKQATMRCACQENMDGAKNDAQKKRREKKHETEKSIVPSRQPKQKA
ncbi:MAG: hypothetical protein IJS54_02850 [Desulfovibrio sp.]|nr:hypothetical protein [Desulfovibrio sp.]